METNKFCSIIIVHYASNRDRSAVFRASLTSLRGSTTYPFELIVIDNGGNIEDSRFLLDLVDKGKINTYIRNTTNMHFGYGRNQGLAVANGDYICIADNDILYGDGWLESCIEVLEEHENEKIYATPIYNVAHSLDKYWSGRVLVVGEKVYRLNSRAGSNCFVVRRRDFERVGRFLCHRVAGTKWTEKAIELGYMAAVTPNLMITDLAFREGYNYKECLPIKETLSDGSDIYFNNDEFRRNNSHFKYRKQGEFRL